MSKKLMPYAIFSLLFEYLVLLDDKGSSGYFIMISLILVIISLVSDLFNLYIKVKK